MPINKYNAQFGGKRGAAAKAKAAMAKEYGPDKGDSVFYATMNKRKKMMKSPGMGMPVSHLPKGACLSPCGDLGEKRQKEGAAAGGAKLYKKSAVVCASRELPG